MDYVEAEGPTIDDAIAAALRQLGVPRERAEIEILANASRGFLGFGGRKARVRASLRRGLDLLATMGATNGVTPAQERADEPAPSAVEENASLSAAEPDSEPHLAPAELLERGRELLQEVVRRIGSDARVEIADGGLLLVGDPSGSLIGRRGHTLDALEYVLNRMLARSDDPGGRVTVDAEQYREKRRTALEELARRLAQQARSRRRPVALRPMSARDRRIVHMALRTEPGVSTRSTGEGPYRKLMIVPKGRRSSRRRQKAPPSSAEG